MKKQRTSEEVADEESRTTAMGLYNTACSYHRAARELGKLGFSRTYQRVSCKTRHIGCQSYQWVAPEKQNLGGRISADLKNGEPGYSRVHIFFGFHR